METEIQLDIHNMSFYGELLKIITFFSFQLQTQIFAIFTGVNVMRKFEFTYVRKCSSDVGTVA